MDDRVSGARPGVARVRTTRGTRDAGRVCHGVVPEPVRETTVASRISRARPRSTRTCSMSIDPIRSVRERPQVEPPRLPRSFAPTSSSTRPTGCSAGTARPCGGGPPAPGPAAGAGVAAGCSGFAACCAAACSRICSDADSQAEIPATDQLNRFGNAFRVTSRISWSETTTELVVRNSRDRMASAWGSLSESTFKTIVESAEPAALFPPAAGGPPGAPP